MPVNFFKPTFTATRSKAKIYRFVFKILKDVLQKNLRPTIAN